MLDSEIKVGMKVNIPTRKTYGGMIAIFTNRLLRDRYDKEYLIVKDSGEDYGRNTGMLVYQLEYDDANLVQADNHLHSFRFYAEDLDPYIPVQDFRTEDEKKEVPGPGIEIFTMDQFLDKVTGAEDIRVNTEFAPPICTPEPPKLYKPTLDDVVKWENKAEEVLNSVVTPEVKEEFNKKFEEELAYGEIPFQGSIQHTSNEPLPNAFDFRDIRPKGEALRYNTGKHDYTLMDMGAFKPMIEVLEYGAHKYSVFQDPHDGKEYKGADISISEAKALRLEVKSSGRDNWKLGGPNMTINSIFSSLFRHTASFLSGEDNDKESGLSHIGHIMCNVMFLGYHFQNHLKNKKAKKGTKFDDRFKS